MRSWENIVETKDGDAWFRDYVLTALASDAPRLPAKSQRLGAVDITWFETEPGIAVITTVGGTVEDRGLARQFMKVQLRGHGIHQAQFTFDQEEEFVKTAHWTDLMAKAKRLIQNGQVRIDRNGYDRIVGQVQGDHGTYQTEVWRDDPNSRAITMWNCDCPWDQFAWQRTRQWKKYEGRPCAHTLALYWKSLATPLDEDSHPAMLQANPQMQGIQQSLFPGTQFANPSPMQTQQAIPASPIGPAAPQQQQLMIPGVAPGMATGVPGDSGIIPPNPMPELGQEPEQPVVSIPGAKPPSPLNPLQWPGGTFSHVANEWELEKIAEFNIQAPGFENGNIVQLLEDDYGMAEGKSEAHGAGQYMSILKNTRGLGEVLGEDNIPGMGRVVEVIFPLDKSRELEPYHIRAWISPDKLKERPDLQRPGPMLKRRT